MLMNLHVHQLYNFQFEPLKTSTNLNVNACDFINFKLSVSKRWNFRSQV